MIFTTIVTFFSGQLGKVSAVVAIVAALAGGAAALLQEHDAKVRLLAQASEQAAQINTMQADYKAAVAGMQAAADAAAARAIRLNNVRTKINATPDTSACSAVPAIRAVLDGLRRPGADGAGPAPGGAGGAAGVRAAP